MLSVSGEGFWTMNVSYIPNSLPRILSLPPPNSSIPFRLLVLTLSLSAPSPHRTYTKFSCDWTSGWALVIWGQWGACRPDPKLRDIGRYKLSNSPNPSALVPYKNHCHFVPTCAQRRATWTPILHIHWSIIHALLPTLVYLRSCNKIPQTEWLINRVYFSQFWRWRPKIRVPTWLREASSLGSKPERPHGVLTWQTGCGELRRFPFVRAQIPLVRTPRSRPNHPWRSHLLTLPSVEISYVCKSFNAP